METVIGSPAVTAALRQVGGEADGLTVVAGARRIGQLRSLGRDRPQFKRSFAPQQDAHQPGAQEQAQAVGQGLDDRGNVRGVPCSTWATSARISARRCSSRETSLSRVASSRLPNCPARMVALAARSSLKKSSIGIVQKGDCANHFVGDQQRRRQQRTSTEFLGCGETRGLHVIGKDRTPLAHGFGGDRTLIRTHPQADKSLGQLSICLFSDQFLPGVGTPEVDTRDLEELACGADRTAESENWHRNARPALAAIRSNSFWKASSEPGVKPISRETIEPRPEMLSAPATVEGK